MLLFWRRTPFSLHRGLYLEKSKALLSWNSPREYGRTPNVVTSSSGPTLAFHWKDEKIFGGISVGVTHRTELKNIFYLYPHLPVGDSWSSPEYAYDFLCPMLKSRFGNPQEQGADRYGPHSTWRYGKVIVHLGIFDRFGPQLGFYVSARDRS